MEQKDLERLLDCCFAAKRITEVLPDLPRGMKPRHIHVLHVVYELQNSAEGCRVSDVSRRLGTTMPSITRLVQELDDKKLLVKHCEAADRRITLLALTDAGIACVKEYIIAPHQEWSAAMGDITPGQVGQVEGLIRRLRDTMPGAGRKNSEAE